MHREAITRPNRLAKRGDYVKPTLMLIACLMCGCVFGIPDANPPVKPPRECTKWVIVQPNNVAHCLTDEEFDRWIKRNLPS